MTTQTIKVDTASGVMEFTGTPVSDSFDYKSFASENGFTDLYIDSPENTDKFGGVGFVVYRNFSDSNPAQWYEQRRLEIVFLNERPLAYRVVG